MKLDVLLGLQWGDEGKGKIVDVLTPRYDVIARFQGGPNAGHTIEFNDNKFILHTIPSGIFDQNKINIMGSGLVIDAYILKKEIEGLNQRGISTSSNLFISKRAHLILPTHRLLDATYEKSRGELKIGSTLKGIGPAYSDKISRNGLRAGDVFSDSFESDYNELKQKHLEIIRYCGFDYDHYELDGFSFNEYEKKWFEGIELIKTLNHISSEFFIDKALREEKRILAEGAQGTMLDIDFGSYPYVTSSNTISAGVCNGLGVAPKKVGKVIGIFKAYCTRVGSGPFPTELLDDDGQKLRDVGKEYGSTTGRPRRCGWLDLPALRYAIMLNGVDELIMMKADVLSPFKTLHVCTEYLVDGKKSDQFPMENQDKIVPVYKSLKGWNSPLNGVRKAEQIPYELKNYIEYIEKETGVPVKIVSVGPDRTQTVML